MLKRNSTEQIVEVLQKTREDYNSGESVRKAYQNAVNHVATKYDVRYQTIADGCRRRLYLSNVDEFINLISEWLGSGNPEALSNILKKHSEKAAHRLIDDFFNQRQSATHDNRPIAPGSGLEQHSEIMTVRISTEKAKKLRALAEIEGVPSQEMLIKLINTSIEEQLRKWASNILSDSNN
jgi:hypothetical protein